MSMLFLLRAAALAAAVAALAPAPADAQERRAQETEETQDAAQEGMHRQMEAMVPMMAGLMKQVTRNTMAALADPEVARDLARFARNYYEALVAEGFSEEEALRIVAGVGFPSIPGR